MSGRSEPSDYSVNEQIPILYEDTSGKKLVSDSDVQSTSIHRSRSQSNYKIDSAAKEPTSMNNSLSNIRKKIKSVPVNKNRNDQHLCTDVTIKKSGNNRKRSISAKIISTSYSLGSIVAKKSSINIEKQRSIESITDSYNSFECLYCNKNNDKDQSTAFDSCDLGFSFVLYQKSRWRGQCIMGHF